MRPRQLHGTPAVADHDHLAELATLEHDCATATTAVLVDHVGRLAAGLGHRGPHDLAGTTPPHAAHQLVVRVENREPVPRDGLHDHLLDLRQLLERVDAAHAEVVGCDVEDDGDIVALVAQALAQDPAPRHL